MGQTILEYRISGDHGTVEKRLERTFSPAAVPEYILVHDRSEFSGYGGPQKPVHVRASNRIVDAILSDLENTSISMGVSEQMGLDGTLFEFRMDRGFRTLSIQWWQEVPAQWANFEDFLHSYEAYFPSCITPQNDQPQLQWFQENGRFLLLSSSHEYFAGLVPDSVMEHVRNCDDALGFSMVQVWELDGSVAPDWWIIPSSWIAKFSDVDGQLFAVAFFEDGQEKFLLVSKEMWARREEAGEIIGRPGLSELGKRALIQDIIDRHPKPSTTPSWGRFPHEARAVKAPSLLKDSFNLLQKDLEEMHPDLKRFPHWDEFPRNGAIGATAAIRESLRQNVDEALVRPLELTLQSGLSEIVNHSSAILDLCSQESERFSKLAIPYDQTRGIAEFILRSSGIAGEFPEKSKVIGIVVEHLHSQLSGFWEDKQG